MVDGYSLTTLVYETSDQTFNYSNLSTDIEISIADPNCSKKLYQLIQSIAQEKVDEKDWRGPRFASIMKVKEPA
jgi:hypothetical protein